MNTPILDDLNGEFSVLLIKGTSIFNYERPLHLTLSEYEKDRAEYAEDWSAAHYSYHIARLRYLVYEAVKKEQPAQKAKAKTHDVQRGRGGGNSSFGEAHDARLKQYAAFAQQVLEKEGDYEKVFTNHKIRIEPLTIPIQYRAMTAAESNAHALWLIHNVIANGKYPVRDYQSLKQLTLENISTEAGNVIIDNYIEGLQEYFINVGNGMANMKYGSHILAAARAAKEFSELDTQIVQAFAKSPQLISELKKNLFDILENDRKIELIELYCEKFTEVLEKSKEYIKYLLKTHSAGAVPITKEFIEKENKIPAWSSKYYYLTFVKLAYVATRILDELEQVKSRVGNTAADKLIEATNNIPFVQKEVIPFPPHSSAQNPAHQFIYDRLKPLSGKWENDRLIMSNTDFVSLTEQVIYISQNNKLPKKRIVIKATPANNDYIKRTIYLIYKYYENETTKIIWSKFILKTFEQFAGNELIAFDKKLSSYKGKFNETYSVLAERLSKL